MDVARRFGIVPDSLKAQAFALFDKGLSRVEVRFVLRDRRRSDEGGTFAATIRAYGVAGAASGYLLAVASCRGRFARSVGKHRY